MRQLFTLIALTFCVMLYAQDQRAEVTFQTNKGTIVVELYNETPQHRDNFLKNVKDKFYNGVLFHRVIKDFMIQAGDPDSKKATKGQLLGDGAETKQVPIEVRMPKYFHKRGALAAAREGDRSNPLRNSSQYQFYIVWGKTYDDQAIEAQQERITKSTNGVYKLTKEQKEVYKNLGGTPHLDGSYTVFGEVTRGLEIVDVIQNVETDKNDRPLDDVKILSAKITRKYKVGKSVNPVFPGWYADPEGAFFEGQYWVYPTLSWPYGDAVLQGNEDLNRQTIAGWREYNIQTYLDAFSSKDLKHWTKHPKVLTMENVPWLQFSLWAPAIIERNGTYYLYFGGNDVHEGEIGGIGVATADNPAGPFNDALGKPLIGTIENGAQPIDQFVFRDDDGQYYMYYGGWGHCNICKMGDDLKSIVPFEDGTMFKEVTPENYVEGPFMLKRNGKYYFMWSEGGWTGPNYCVAYAIADSPFGPFKRIGKILQQDPSIATGAGHHSVINVPGTDKYYIVYHRRPLWSNRGNEREVCIDKLEFDKDGFIKPVKMSR